MAAGTMTTTDNQNLTW